MIPLLDSPARLLAGLFVVWMLSGCATTTPVLTNNIAALEQWQLRGKIGLRTPERAANMAFNWTQQATGDFSIRFTGPLGVPLGSVEGNLRAAADGTGDWAVAEFDGEQVEGPIDTLLLPALGFDVPLRSLHFWVRGLADPKMPAARSQAGFQQLGWRILPTIREDAGGLPAKVRIEGRGLTLRLAGLRWML